MKRLFLVVLLSLFFVPYASAANLTANPQLASAVTQYRVQINGVTFSADIESTGDGLVRINYSVDHLLSGNYTAVAAAGNDNNQWSEWSTPVLEFAINETIPCENIVLNSGFEEGTDLWNFFTAGEGDFIATSPAYDGLASACLTIDTWGTNIQLNQSGISLDSSTTYRLTFVAKSNTGHDFKVSIFKDAEPYTNYGIPSTVVEVMTFWSAYEIEFTTPDFGASVNDARLMFWFADHAQNGDEYWIDNIVISTADSSSSPDAPQGLIFLP